jgi:hypothetical protein
MLADQCRPLEARPANCPKAARDGEAASQLIELRLTNWPPSPPLLALPAVSAELESAALDALRATLYAHLLWALIVLAAAAAARLARALSLDQIRQVLRGDWFSYFAIRTQPTPSPNSPPTPSNALDGRRRAVPIPQGRLGRALYGDLAGRFSC